MAGLLFVVFWAAAYSAAWWGAPYLGKFLPVTSPTAFNVIRVVLSIVFCLVVLMGVIFRNVLIYFVDGVDPGPPMGGGPVVAAIVFGSRLGASRDPEHSSLPGSSRARPKPGGLDQGSSASSNPTLPSNPRPSQIATGRVAGTRMSDAQRRILCFSLAGLAVLLLALFIRIGSRLDYKGSMVIIELSRVDNPYSWHPSQSDTLAWGILVRMGEFGIVLGVLLPTLLLIIAAILRQDLLAEPSGKISSAAARPSQSQNVPPARSRDNLAPQKSEGVSSQRGEDMRDPYKIAGDELLTSKVEPAAWARALVNGNGDGGAVNAAYVRLRVAELEARAVVVTQAEQDRQILQLTPDHEERAAIARKNAVARYHFSEAELSVYGKHQLDVLARALRDANSDELYSIRNTIGKKIGRVAGVDDERPFLEAYYAQLRERLDRMS